MKFLLFLAGLLLAVVGAGWLLVKLAKAGTVLPRSVSEKVLALAAKLSPASAPAASVAWKPPAFGTEDYAAGGTSSLLLLNPEFPA
jgi:hypothetical protein